MLRVWDLGKIDASQVERSGEVVVGHKSYFQWVIYIPVYIGTNYFQGFEALEGEKEEGSHNTETRSNSFLVSVRYTRLDYFNSIL